MVAHSKKKFKENIVMGIAWYTSEQYERLLKISADRNDMEDSYKDWLVSAEKAIKQFRLRGIDACKVNIDVDELALWCQLEGTPVDGSARSRFASYKLQEMMGEKE